MNVIALSIVLVLVSITIGIAWYSRRWTRTTSEFYVAGQKISWVQNALALTGDYLSAASFLGVTGAIAILGIDRTWDAIGYFGGYIVLLALLAVPLRKVGKFTASEILTTRFRASKTVRTSAMLGSTIISSFYIVPQLVGAGALMQILLGWDYVFSVLIIGTIVIIYVVMGGMRATTYNAVIQAIVLWFAMLLILLLTVILFFDYNPMNIIDSVSGLVPPEVAAGMISDGAVVEGNYQEVINEVSDKLTGGADTALTPGAFAPDWMNLFALATGLVFGTAGLPHVLKRYYTVDKPKDARTSTIGVLFAIGSFYVMAIFAGLAAMVLLYPDLIGFFQAGEESVAQNMAIPLLGELVGGDVLLGLAIGGAFCAILSTVAGLLMTIGTTLTHDYYMELINPDASEKKEVFVAKLSIVATGIIAVLVALALGDQNVSFLVTLAFGIAASVFFPVLFMSVWWKGYTRQGAIATMATGLIIAVLFVVAHLVGMTSVLGLPVLVNPALYSLPSAIIAGIVVSLFTNDVGEVDKFMALAHRKEE
ncbi:Na+(or H+)/acetate symporter ActP [Methanonatronarchaeum thermophilum]|uniref:Na+(Or H+)/acetate symporter ActP n=1 Tax=Methanonatronarchaeum thermophilum TaxID=1927129 RepID=A0A1Y3GFV9_9EURY|nr:cation acetate symporter [Methanonatronarchaeum thermophilum]OUJ19084.1 Na+(or H+)/acetate symporter ActP [Methanonatronarchaeum thermophilum]